MEQTSLMFVYVQPSGMNIEQHTRSCRKMCDVVNTACDVTYQFTKYSVDQKKNMLWGAYVISFRQVSVLQRARITCRYSQLYYPILFVALSNYLFIYNELVHFNLV